MPTPGQIVLFPFPLTSLDTGKLRPALLLAQVPGPYRDWFLCMVSSQLRQYVPGFDELITPEADDFAASGLKVTSVVRIGRLAVVDESLLVGAIGEIAPSRHTQICRRLADWLLATGHA